MGWNPFNWTAGPFLTLYAILAIIVCFWGLRLRSTIGPATRVTHPLTVLELAFLEGGARRVGDLVLVQLMMGNGVAMGFGGRGITVFDQTPLDTLADPPIRLSVQPNMTRAQFQTAAQPLVERARDRLEAFGYSPTDAQISSFRGKFLSMLLMLLVFGGIKACVGAARHHPVGYLVLLLVGTMLVGIALTRRPTRTRAGDEATDRLRAAHKRAMRAPLDDELPLAVAITGAAVLTGTAYESVYAASKRMNADGDNGCGGGDGDSAGSGGGDSGCGGCN